jgi:signal transduction histidine kinase
MSFLLPSSCFGWTRFVMGLVAGFGLVGCDEVGELRALREQMAMEEKERQTLPEVRTVAQTHQRIGFHGRAGADAWVMVDLGKAVRPDEIVLFPARISDPALDDPTGGFPPEIEVLLAETLDDSAFQPVAHWKEATLGAGSELPLLRLPLNGQAGRFVKLVIRGGRQRSGRLFFTLGEIVVLEQGSNHALGAEVMASPGINNAPRWASENLTDGFLWCGNLHGTARSRSNGFHSRIESDPEQVPKWVEVDLGQTLEVDEVRLVPARPADFADVTGFGFPPAFRVLIAEEDDPAFARPKTVFASAPEVAVNPGDAAWCVKAAGLRGRRVRVQADRLWQRSGDYIFALAELQVLAAGRNVALGRPVAFSDAVEGAASWQPEALVDGFASQRELLNWARWLEGVSRRMKLEHSLAVAGRRLDQMETLKQQRWLRLIAGLGLALLVLGALVIWGLHRRQRQARQRLRESIARDLHDEMGSHLSHLALLAESGEPEALPLIANGARELQGAMRDLVWLLDPGSGEARDFASRLRSTCRQLLAPVIEDINIESVGEPPAGRLPLEWTRQVLLFVREAVSNAARHSAASKVDLRFEWTASSFQWCLSDDGCGFDEAAVDFRAGSGLRNLRHRAAALGGTMTLSSEPEKGTRLCLKCPLPAGR